MINRFDNKFTIAIDFGKPNIFFFYFLLTNLNSFQRFNISLFSILMTCGLRVVPLTYVYFCNDFSIEFLILNMDFEHPLDYSI